MGANTANTANTANAGNTGSASGYGGEWVFANRANRPFVLSPLVSGNPLAVTTTAYRDRKWDAYWYAWTVLAEFSASLWPGMTTSTSPSFLTVVDPATFSAAQIQTEIDALRALARLERPDAMGEIIAQKDEFVSYFMALLHADPYSHPNTYRVLYSASQIALMAAMYFKAKYNRARPAQLYPPLLPPCDTPGHASYPSGHATQSCLMELCMGLVLNGAAGMAGSALAGADAATLNTDLHAMAIRIAHNREIAGFHYHSDTTNGRQLAADIFAQMQADLGSGAPKLQQFSKAVTAAQSEWSTP